MTVPISDEELDHQRDVLQAMLDSGIPMDDGGIAKALAVNERLDQSEIENVHLRRLVNHYVGITPLARITELEDALRSARTEIERSLRLLTPYARNRILDPNILDAIDRVLGQA